MSMVLLVFNSCKKEHSKPNQSATQQILSLTEARAFFENSVLPQSSKTIAALNSKKTISAANLANDKDLNDLLYKAPVWSKAYYKETEYGTGIAIPIHFQVTSFIKTGSTSGVNFDALNYLLITRQKEGKLIAEWVTLYPTKEWIKGNRATFTGRITVKDWDGNLKKAFTFDGKKIEKFVAAASPTSFESLLQQYKTGANGRVMSVNIGANLLMTGRRYQDVSGTCWEDIREVPFPDGTIGVTLYRKEIDCALLEPEQPTEPTGPNIPSNPYTGGNGGGSGSGGYQPCDPNNVPAYIPPGMNYCADAPIVEETINPTKEINNNLTDPCLKTTITEALATNKDVKGFLSDLINKYAGLNNGIVINISNGDISDPAKIFPSFDSDGTFKADIIFQNGYHNDVSKESVVAALIHEVVHAYLYQTNNTYKNQPKTAQHNFLFTNFVHDIATYLINKYNMPYDDAYGLAWSGMGDIYNNANSNDTFVTSPAVPATANSPAIPAKTMTKTELGAKVAPYKHTDSGSKRTPNCPK